MSEIYLVNTEVPDLRIGSKAGVSASAFSGTLGEVNLSVGPAPRYVSAFTFSASEGTVTFSDTSYATSDAAGSPHTLAWDFGDGSTSTSPNPSHTYSTSGNYNVALTATWDTGSSSSTQQISVSIWAPAAVLYGSKIPTFYAPGTKLLNSLDSLVYTASADGWGDGSPVVEDQNYLYDAGQPFDIYSEMSKFGITEQQRQDILAQHNFYLQEAPVTAAQWASLRAALAGDPNPGGITSDFGYPAIGMGIDITDRPTNEASATILEAMVMLAVDKANFLDNRNYGIGKLDAQDEISAIMYSGSIPPIPTVVPLNSTYDSLDTPLTSVTPARVFQVTFNASRDELAAMHPTFSIWLPDNQTPIQVAVVERVSLGVYRFSVPKPTKAKIIVG